MRVSANRDIEFQLLKNSIDRDMFSMKLKYTYDACTLLSMLLSFSSRVCLLIFLLDHFVESISFLFFYQVCEVVIAVIIIQRFILASELFFFFKLVCVEDIDVRVASSLKLKFSKVFTVKLILLHLQKHNLIEFVFNFWVPLWFRPVILLVFVFFP
jgi:hypothetical protein